MCDIMIMKMLIKDAGHRIMKLSIFYTNHCNINCDHCFLGKQVNRCVMNRKMLHNVLIQAKSLGINTVSFTGGEPFLYFNSIIKITISTNGYWANTIENTNKICKELSKSCVSQLEISCDEYHIKYIPLENILNIINIAQKYQILVKIIMSVSSDLSFLRLYSKLVKHIPSDKVIIQRVALFGNAKDNSIDCSIELNKFKDTKCEQILNPCITYSGDIFACCGPCVVLGKKNNLYLSNISENTLDFAINRMMSNNIIQKIAKDGPCSILSEFSNQKCSYLCEICMKTNWEMA